MINSEDTTKNEMNKLSKKQAKGNILFYVLGYLLVIQIIVGVSFGFLFAVTRSSFFLGNNAFHIANIIALIGFILINRNYLVQEWIKFKQNMQLNLISVFKWQAILYVGNLVINYILSLILSTSESANQSAVIDVLDGQLLLGFFSIVIFAPLVEEMIYRASIFSLLNRKMAIVVSALLFGLAHVFSSVLAGNWMDVFYIISYSYMGWCFAASYAKSENIFVPVLFHALNNSIAFIFIVLA